MRHALMMCLIATGLLAVTACSNEPALADADTLRRLNEASSAANQTGGYRLGSGDRLRVVVFNEEQLTGEVMVDPNGAIGMALAGSVRAAGRTTEQLAADIAARLRGTYLRDPNVSVQVLQTRPFYVIGEVARPGEYPYRAGMTVQTAVAVAGGFTFRANQRRVFVTREAFGSEVAVPVSSFQLAPGDLLRVGERLF